MTIQEPDDIYRIARKPTVRALRKYVFCKCIALSFSLLRSTNTKHMRVYVLKVIVKWTSLNIWRSGFNNSKFVHLTKDSINEIPTQKSWVWKAILPNRNHIQYSIVYTGKYGLSSNKEVRSLHKPSLQYPLCWHTHIMRTRERDVDNETAIRFLSRPCPTCRTDSAITPWDHAEGPPRQAFQE